MPEMPEGCELSPNDLAVFFGKSVALTQNFPFTILNISGTEMLAIEAVPDKPQININILRIFDDLGNIIARIDSGGFWVAPNVRRQKPNRSTLIVFDRSDEQVLKVELMNPRALYVEGVFRDRKGVTVKILPDRVILPGNNTLFLGCIRNVRTAIRVH
jgi:hypothetical protein